MIRFGFSGSPTSLELWCALEPVGSVVVACRPLWDLNSLTGDQTHVLCIGRQILNHWATREVPKLYVLIVVVMTRLHACAKALRTNKHREPGVVSYMFLR